MTAAESKRKLAPTFCFGTSDASSKPAPVATTAVFDLVERR
jgi:hypothetical protein